MNVAKKTHPLRPSGACGEGKEAVTKKLAMEDGEKHCVQLQARGERHRRRKLQI